MKEADWHSLELELLEVNWEILHRETAENAVIFLQEDLWAYLLKHILRNTARFTCSFHPWMNSRCCHRLKECM